MARTRDITVIGASAGGVSALRTLLGGLPADYRAAVLVVLHVAPESPSLLRDILDRATPLSVIKVRGGEPLRPGRVYVAPPDHHLLVERDIVRLSHGPRENRHRPSIDVLFRSAAVAHGARVTGVVLSGMLDDGAAGLWAIKKRGGIAIVQDPEDAEYPDMPRNAMHAITVDHCLPLAAIADRLVALAREEVGEPIDAAPRSMATEVRMAAEHQSSMDDLDTLGKRSPLTCPECGGALWQMDEAGAQRFRCHVGHAYSIRTLAAEQSSRVEAALWAALRSLEEKERLAHKMAGEAASRGNVRSAASYTDHARSSATHAEVLRGMLGSAVPYRGDPFPDEATSMENRK
jgi:two-component system chemotaxis response regulator CheB